MLLHWASDPRRKKKACCFRASMTKYGKWNSQPIPGPEERTHNWRDRKRRYMVAWWEKTNSARQTDRNSPWDCSTTCTLLSPSSKVNIRAQHQELWDTRLRTSPWIRTDKCYTKPYSRIAPSRRRKKQAGLPIFFDTTIGNKNQIKGVRCTTICRKDGKIFDTDIWRKQNYRNDSKSGEFSSWYSYHLLLWLWHSLSQITSSALQPMFCIWTSLQVSDRESTEVIHKEILRKSFP